MKKTLERILKIQDKIVTVRFKNILYKITEEKFDANEIEEYLKMSIEDYNGNNLSLSTEDMIKWMEYRIISFACIAIGLNKAKAYRKKFLSLAKVYRKKCEDME